ncbi:DNA repair protein RadC [Pasteurellaceae bacterium LIM206]|nr:DNA repair protein RadC [Pasteurellaceae bacterium LIM206]
MYQLSNHERQVLNDAKQILTRVMESMPLYNESAVFTIDEAITYVKARIGLEERENFLVLFLNNAHCLLSAEVLFSGTINEAPVYTREIVKRAMALNAAAVIVAHNHPSGEVQPSQSDRNITSKIQKACELVDTRLLDHIIVSVDKHFSFAEEHMLCS